MYEDTEKVVIAGLKTPDVDESFYEESMAELARLVESAGGEVVARFDQSRRKRVAATFIGTGKLEQIKQILDEKKVNTVVFDDDLKPNQARNIEKALGRDVKIIDRSGLILDIFATRARTNAAKIQVELAQLEYRLPRLSGMWEHLSRQFGGSIGARGPGETQLEIDRRVVRNRIIKLKQRLEKIETQRRTQRKGRASAFRVALVGYTNAGKSTLLNKLTHAQAFAADKLFATLDPRTRIYRTPDGRKLLFTDTVGFIRKLPHHLVESFRSTLAEATEANLLLIVADAGHAALQDHLDVVDGELQRLGLSDAPKILVINKIDVVDELQLMELEGAFPEAVFVSAKTGKGLEALLGRVFESMPSIGKTRYLPNRLS
ncbi:GTPase HflX [bacterium]|nr:GTPase HflX [bacterium]